MNLIFPHIDEQPAYDKLDFTDHAPVRLQRQRGGDADGIPHLPLSERFASRPDGPMGQSVREPGRPSRITSP